jgi:hypothetical protein
MDIISNAVIIGNITAFTTAFAPPYTSATTEILIPAVNIIPGVNSLTFNFNGLITQSYNISVIQET